MRSWLYVPGDRGDRLARSADRGADALIFDLEDAVAGDRKDDARRLVREALSAVDPATWPAVWVRVDPGNLRADVEAVACGTLTGIVLAKAEADRLDELDGALTTAEATLGPPRRFAVVALIETALGLTQVDAVARAPRVRNLAFGEADLTAEVGVDPSDAAAVLALRMPLVVASAAAGLHPPTGPTSTDYRDLDGLRTSTRALLRQGFRARSAIHPAQIEVINDALTPTAREVAQAREQVAAFERSGGGATTADDATLVDAATVRAARDVLARARAAERA